MLKGLVLFLGIIGFSSLSIAVGNPDAPKGGVVYLDLGTEPASLNPFTANDGYSQVIFSKTFDSLISRSIETFEVEGAIADKWEVSKDGLSFTFYLRKGLKFDDGKPLTAEDVKFSYEAIMNPDYKAVILRPFYSFIENVTIHDPHKITFKVKEKYFKNIDFIGGMPVMPKHKYGNPKKKFNKKVFASGPYKLDKWDKGRKIVLKRNKNWYGYKLAENKGKYNFKKIVYRFVKDPNVKVEMLKKGRIDYMGMRPQIFGSVTKGPEWGKKVFAVKTTNEGAQGYGYVGWNLRDEKFKDAKVRKGLSLLLNRDFIIDKFMHNLYKPAVGPWYPSSMYADPSVKPDKFAPAKALALFREAGWSDSNKDGVLDKMINGKRVDFRFTIITGADETIKILTTYKEDAKKVGVDVNLKLVEWQTLLKLKDEEKFDGIAMAWGGVVHSDPHQIWHSSNDVRGGSNYVGYNNPKVDKWITEARGILDNKARVPVMRKIYKQVAEDRPYLFLFTPKYTLYAHTARMQKEKDTYRFGVGVDYWWAKKK